MFEVAPLIAAPKFVITSATVLRDRLFVGADDGSLRVYDVVEGEEAGMGSALEPAPGAEEEATTRAHRPPPTHPPTHPPTAQPAVGSVPTSWRRFPSSPATSGPSAA